MTRRLDSATYLRIREVIASHVGREHATTTREILEILRSTGTPTHSRRVSETIRTMQAECEPVLSHSTFGIWMAGSDDELAATESELRKRRRAIDLKLADLARIRSRRIQGQIAGVA